VPEDLGDRRVQAWSCTGECVRDEQVALGDGVHTIAIPPAGTAVIA
jgi:hypothetical protein